MANGTGDKDLDWLYGREDADPTRVFSPDEVARMQRSATSGPAPQPTQAPPPPPPPPHVQYGHGSYTPPPPPPARGRPPRRGRVRRTIVTLLVLWLAFMIGTPLHAWFRGTVVEAAPSGDRPAQQPGTAVLLVGSDSREGLTPEEQGTLGTGDTEGRRTDTMMILYTPPSGRSALISLPRDSYLPIPGHKRNKLNAAFAIGGPPLLVETVERNTGTRIDGYLEVGFKGIVDVVDALGGIEVCLDAPIKDRDSHLDLPAGCQTLDGKTALGYVRMRKADPRGDLGRMERQREVIGKVVGKAMNPLHLLNPVTYWRLNMAASDSLSRSKDVGLGQMFSVAGGFVSSATGSGLSLTVPIADANADTSAGSAVIWDEKASAEMFAAIQSGDTKALEKFQR